MEQDYMVLGSAAAKKLFALGIYPTQDAFWQILAGVEILSRSPSMLANAKKLLYPAIAKKCECSEHAVDCSLRRSIKKAWEQGTIHTAKRPTNAEFFAMLMVDLAEADITSTC